MEFTDVLHLFFRKPQFYWDAISIGLIIGIYYGLLFPNPESDDKDKKSKDKKQKENRKVGIIIASVFGTVLFCITTTIQWP